MAKRTGVTRRAFLAGASVGLSGAALAGGFGACSPAGSTSQPTASGAAGGGVAPTPPANSAAVTPRRGGTLRWAQVGDYPSLEGQTMLAPAIDTLWTVWDRLISLDTHMQPQPMLAESWEMSRDYTQIKFNLRRGVQFHTGRELTADDVKWCLQRLKDPKAGSNLTGRAQPVVGVETPDPYTVVVKASRPWAEAFDFFEFVNIIDPVTSRAAGVMQPTGTGPFVFAEYVQGDHLRLVRNLKYWRNDRPYVDEILVSIRRDGQAAVVQLEAGALDVVGFGLPVSAALRLESDSAYAVLFNATTGASWILAANCTQLPTNNRLVRQALNYALDRTRIAESAWHGQAKPEALPWSPTSPAYDAARSTAIGFDLDKARLLLAASGASNIRLEVQWPTSIDDFAQVAQIYQADLAKIGVAADLKPVEPVVHVNSLNNRSYHSLGLVLGTYGNLRPANLLQGVLYGSETNISGFKDDGYTQLVNQMLAATDQARQQSLYTQWNDFFVDQAWALPLTQNPPHVAARANVRGLRFDAHEALVLSEVWLT